MEDHVPCTEILLNYRLDAYQKVTFSIRKMFGMPSLYGSRYTDKIHSILDVRSRSGTSSTTFRRKARASARIIHRVVRIPRLDLQSDWLAFRMDSQTTLGGISGISSSDLTFAFAFGTRSEHVQTYRSFRKPRCRPVCLVASCNPGPARSQMSILNRWTTAGPAHSQGIRPLVTMFHWDLPEKLDWLDEEVVDYFVEYPGSTCLVPILCTLFRCPGPFLGASSRLG